MNVIDIFLVVIVGVLAVVLIVNIQTKTENKSLNTVESEDLKAIKADVSQLKDTVGKVLDATPVKKELTAVKDWASSLEQDVVNIYTTHSNTISPLHPLMVDIQALYTKVTSKL